jgi:hypothetical protein
MALSEITSETNRLPVLIFQFIVHFRRLFFLIFFKIFFFLKMIVEIYFVIYLKICALCRCYIQCKQEIKIYVRQQQVSLNMRNKTAPSRP